MSGYILCQAKKAVEPFYLESINRNLFSYEELCYFITNNLYLLDKKIFNEKLSIWIIEELELTKLGRRIKALLEEEAMIEDFIVPIVKELNYLSIEEYRILNIQLTKYQGQPLIMREKLKADTFVYHGKYGEAIYLYQKILLDQGVEQQGGAFVGSIYHNLGCAYIRLFQQEEAMECFYKAYERLHSHESLKSYLIAYYMCRDEEDYENKILELGIDGNMKETLKKEISKAKELSKEKGVGAIYLKALQEKKDENKKGYEKAIDGLLMNLTREYHRNTGL